uniref:Uncharacterized protein n=1 Tax=Peronospora matthiolae TaxID=2874970 RepID=A0AAV1VAN5_9STRA
MSDVETVFNEDSPLSPCVWTYPVVEATSEVAPTGAKDKVAEEEEDEEEGPLAAKLNAAAPTRLFQNKPSRLDRKQHLPRHELQLSPGSQLDVLAQISELADAQSRPSVATSRPTRQMQRASIWGTGTQTAKRSSAAASRIAAKRQKHAPKQSARSQAERLTADMLDWETCSEGELFALDEEEEADLWVYEDILDSDFET